MTADCWTAEQIISISISHSPIFTVLHFYIITFSHFDILTLLHFVILTFCYYHILTFSHFYILTFSHFDILTIWQSHILTFSHSDILTFCVPCVTPDPLRSPTSPNKLLIFLILGATCCFFFLLSIYEFSPLWLFLFGFYLVSVFNQRVHFSIFPPFYSFTSC